MDNEKEQKEEMDAVEQTENETKDSKAELEAMKETIDELKETIKGNEEKIFELEKANKKLALKIDVSKQETEEEKNTQFLLNYSRFKNMNKREENK